MVSIGPACIFALDSFQNLIHRFHPVIVCSMNDLHHILSQSSQAIGKRAVEPGLAKRIAHCDDHRRIPARRVFRMVILSPDAHSIFPYFLDSLFIGSRDCILNDA